MIVHLDIKIKNKCKKCNGTGEMLKDMEISHNLLGVTGRRLITYMCTNCNGNGHTWKKRTITSKQLKGILDEKN